MENNIDQNNKDNTIDCTSVNELVDKFNPDFYDKNNLSDVNNNLSRENIPLVTKVNDKSVRELVEEIIDEPLDDNYESVCVKNPSGHSNNNIYDDTDYTVNTESSKLSCTTTNLFIDEKSFSVKSNDQNNKLKNISDYEEISDFDVNSESSVQSDKDLNNCNLVVFVNSEYNSKINDNNNITNDNYVNTQFEFDESRFQTDYLYQEYIQQYYPEYYDVNYFPQGTEHENLDEFEDKKKDSHDKRESNNYENINREINNDEYVNNEYDDKISKHKIINEEFKNYYSDSKNINRFIEPKYTEDKIINYLNTTNELDIEEYQRLLDEFDKVKKSFKCYVNLDKQIPEKKIVVKDKINMIINNTLKKIKLTQNKEEDRKNILDQQQKIIILSNNKAIADNFNYLDDKFQDKECPEKKQEYSEKKQEYSENKLEYSEKKQEYSENKLEYTENKQDHFSNNFDTLDKYKDNNNDLEVKNVDNNSISEYNNNEIVVFPKANVSFANAPVSSLLPQYKNPISKNYFNNNITNLNNTPFVKRPNKDSRHTDKRNFEVRKNNLVKQNVSFNRVDKQIDFSSQIQIKNNIEYIKHLLNNQNLKKNSVDAKSQPNFYNSTEVKKEFNESMKFNILKKFNVNPIEKDKDNKSNNNFNVNIKKYESTNQYNSNKIYKNNNTNSVSNKYELKKTYDSKPNLSDTINSENQIHLENKKNINHIINQRHKTNWNKPINQIFLENNTTYPLTKNGKTNYISDEYIKYQNWINNQNWGNSLINNLSSNNLPSKHKLITNKENKIIIDNINEFKDTYRKNNNRSYFPGNNTEAEIQNYSSMNDFNQYNTPKTSTKTRFVQMHNKKNQYKTIN
jgi:hypothetical protein